MVLVPYVGGYIITLLPTGIEYHFCFICATNIIERLLWLHLLTSLIWDSEVDDGIYHINGDTWSWEWALGYLISDEHDLEGGYRNNFEKVT